MIRTAWVRDPGGMTEERMKKAGADGALIDFDICQEGGQKNANWNHFTV